MEADGEGDDPEVIDVRGRGKNISLGPLAFSIVLN